MSRTEKREEKGEPQRMSDKFKNQSIFIFMLHNEHQAVNREGKVQKSVGKRKNN